MVDMRGFEAVIKPILNSFLPKRIEEPECKLCKDLRELVKKLIKDEQGQMIADRVVVAACEQDPEACYDQLTRIAYHVDAVLERNKTKVK